MRARPLGFSLVELLLTLVALSLLVLVLLRVVGLSTKIAEPQPREEALDVALASALEAIARDVRDAGTGGLPADEAILPLFDNNRGDVNVRDARNDVMAVRPGTDVLRIRGVLRSPLYILDTRDRATGEPFSEAIRRDPSSANLRMYASPARANPSRRNEPFDPLVARLGIASLKSLKRFFLVEDVEGRLAVARVLEVDAGKLGADDSIRLRLDFTDPDAISFNGRGGREAALRLSALVAGGLFDELLYFVARGEPGKEPDYRSVEDPASLAYPHPFLAAAEAVGDGRYDVARVADEVENLQAAFGLAPTPGGPSGLDWRADRRGRPAASGEDFVDSLGRPVLRAVRIAVVVKGATRSFGPSARMAPEPDVLPLNAPAPAPNAPAPIGWALNPMQRVNFERGLEVLTLVPRNFAGEGS